MPSLTIPYVFTAETDADAAQVNADFQAVVAKFNGGIVDDNLAVGADIDSNKLSQTSGKLIPTAAIGPAQVTDAKLAFDAVNPGNDAIRAVSGDHIKLLTLAAIKRLLPTAAGTPKDGINLDKLGITVYTSGTLDSGQFNRNYDLGHTPATAFSVTGYTPLAAWVDTSSVTGTISSMTSSVTFIQSGGNWTLWVKFAFTAVTPGAGTGITSVVRALFIKNT